MVTWSTRLDGDPVACAHLAARLRMIAGEVERVAGTLPQESPALDWIGTASGQAALRVAEHVADARRLAGRLRRLADGVASFGDGLAQVASDLHRALGWAVADGLAVSAEGFDAPEGHRAATLVRAARGREADAHEALSGLLVTVTQGSFVRRTTRDLVDGLLLLPPDGDGWDRAAWGVGVPGSIASLPTDRLKANVSLVVSGATKSSDARVARTARAVEAVAPAGKGLLKCLGIVGNGATVALDGRDQWRADADDPALTQAERVGRTAVRGALEGGATVLGAAAIGAAMSPIPGGAYVGGVVGGKIGEIGGKLVADVAVEHVDDVIELAGDVADLAEETGDAVSGAAEAVGDAAGSVADKVCFWR